MLRAVLGGGLRNYASTCGNALLMLNRTRFSANSAESGGAISVDGSVTFLTDCQVADNVAVNRGGAVAYLEQCQDLEVTGGRGGLHRLGPLLPLTSHTSLSTQRRLVNAGRCFVYVFHRLSNICGMVRSGGTLASGQTSLRSIPRGYCTHFGAQIQARIV